MTRTMGITAAIFILVVLIAVIAAGIAFARFSASAGWEPAEGRILSSEVRTIGRTPGTAAQSDHGPTDYEAAITYEYNAAGQTHTGSRIYAGLPPTFNSSSDAREMVERFPEGETVTVYYDAGNPASACLIPASEVSIGGFIVLGGMVLLIGGIVIVGALFATGAIDVSKLKGGQDNAQSTAQPPTEQ